MQSTARVGTHPIHPMLVPFPFAFWTASTVLHLWSAVSDHYHDYAYWAAVAGCAMAVVAAVPGAIDLFTAVPAGSAARRTGIRHAVLNVAALLLFTASILLVPDPGAMNYASWAAVLLGFLCVGIAGWFGGALVYDHRVGVPEPERGDRA